MKIEMAAVTAKASTAGRMKVRFRWGAVIDESLKPSKGAGTSNAASPISVGPSSPIRARAVIEMTDPTAWIAANDDRISAAELRW